MPSAETHPGAPRLPRTVLMTADAIGGVWSYALELARGLASHGVRVELATMGAHPSAVQRAEAAALPNLRLHESSYRLEWMPDPWSDVDRAGEWLLELEQTLEPGLIHLNGFAHASLPWRAPTLVVAHSCVLSWWRAVKNAPAPPEWSEYQRRTRDGLAAARLVVAPTAAMLATLPENYGALGDSRVIYNGRSAADFPPAPKERLILAAGRLGDEAKNIAALCAAARGLDWPVMLAGAGHDASGSLALPANVEHLGVLSSAALAHWLGRASIYCLPARYEPFGLSILEAALAGCALVLGDIPSLRELWQGTAMFVPPGETGTLQAALRNLTKDEAEVARLGAFARARALHFTPERCTAAYLAAYGSLLSDLPFSGPALS